MKLKNFFDQKKSHVLIIAEACDNHFGSLAKAKKMIIKAKWAGADVIKFQHHIPDEEMLRKVPKSKNFVNDDLYSFLKKNALKLSDHIKLKNFCDKVGIQYLCTPFSLKAAKELVKFVGVDGFKIGSGEMTDVPTLLEITKFKKPMIISTGMSYTKEIMRTYNNLKNKKVKLAFLHCLSEYPVNYKDLNLGYIPILKKKLNNCIIGFSDHSSDLIYTYAAVALGAKIVERHVTLDKKLAGPDQSVSIDFEELKLMISKVRKIEQSIGINKTVHKDEKIIRKWAFRSLVAIKNIEKNEKFSLDNIWSKRPGLGVPSVNMRKFLGKKSKRSISKDSFIKWKDIKKI